MTDKYKTVTIVKTVPVADKETLIAWLNGELADWLRDKRDGGSSKATAGAKAIELIYEAGFTLNITSPRVNREHGLEFPER